MKFDLITSKVLKIGADDVIKHSFSENTRKDRSGLSLMLGQKRRKKEVEVSIPTKRARPIRPTCLLLSKKSPTFSKSDPITPSPSSNSCSEKRKIHSDSDFFLLRTKRIRHSSAGNDDSD